VTKAELHHRITSSREDSSIYVEEDKSSYVKARQGKNTKHWMDGYRIALLINSLNLNSPAPICSHGCKVTLSSLHNPPSSPYLCNDTSTMPCRLVRSNACCCLQRRYSNLAKRNIQRTAMPKLVNSTSIQVEREEKMRRMPVVLLLKKRKSIRVLVWGWEMSCRGRCCRLNSNRLKTSKSFRYAIGRQGDAMLCCLEEVSMC
jgi:hypothetical protein